MIGTCLPSVVRAFVCLFVCLFICLFVCSIWFCFFIFCCFCFLFSLFIFTLCDRTVAIFFLNTDSSNGCLGYHFGLVYLEKKCCSFLGQILIFSAFMLVLKIDHKIIFLKFNFLSSTNIKNQLILVTTS